jgi:hypothetical protein
MTDFSANEQTIQKAGHEAGMGDYFAIRSSGSWRSCASLLGQGLRAR